MTIPTVVPGSAIVAQWGNDVATAINQAAADIDTLQADVTAVEADVSTLENTVNNVLWNELFWPWMNLTPASGWSTVTGASPRLQHRKIGGVGICVGAFNRTSSVNGSDELVATLPIGYRPPGTVRSVYTVQGAIRGVAEIRSTGQVYARTLTDTGTIDFMFTYPAA